MQGEWDELRPLPDGEAHLSTYRYAELSIAAAIRLAGALLIEQNDEWLVSRRYLSAESIALALEDQGDEGREEVAALQAA